MMRSLYSGISGLKNHQTRMDVIGNNVSNVNTTGFKASRTIFQDIFSQTVSSGMANTGISGGTNPIQIGLGIRLSTIDVMHTGAPFGRTDNPFDMMIENEGFFIVRDATGGHFYTRVGNFGIDNEGYLVTSDGMFVMGNMFDLAYVPGEREDIPIDLNRLVNNKVLQTLIPGFPNNDNPDHWEPGSRKRVNPNTHPWVANATLGPPPWEGFPNPNNGDHWIPDTGRPLAIDSSTVKATITALFPDPAQNSHWLDSPTNSIPVAASIAALNRNNPTHLAALENLLPGYPDPDEGRHWPAPGQPGARTPIDLRDRTNTIAQAIVTARLPDFWDDDLAADEGSYWIPNSGVRRDLSDPVVLADLMAPYGTTFPLPIDIAPEHWQTVFTPGELEVFELPFEADNLRPIRLRVEDDDGMPIDLLGFSVGEDGTVSIIFNNLRVNVAQLAIAMFANTNGLERAGNSLWRATASSGDSVYTQPMDNGSGTIRGGGLEMSNVDLSSEFTDMIVTQRGYQANSRIITVSDSLLEELVNLKR